MSNTPPCARCGHGERLVLPGMAIDVAQVTTLLGMRAYQNLPGRWEGTIVVCTRCTHTELFTTNGPDLLRTVPGASLARSSGG